MQWDPNLMYKNKNMKIFLRYLQLNQLLCTCLKTKPHQSKLIQSKKLKIAQKLSF